ncbi:MAG TPA: hypothetical protein VFN61_10175 [Acidimicrobiales bacterium]|nr:hypothetical protein [Acidimicrobiales bacterium]
MRANGSVAHYGIHYFGDLSKDQLPKPIVGAAGTADGGGYWLVASNGGVYDFGDAYFHGSAGGLTLHRPIVAMAATPDGGGYWLVASDGGIFAYGDARFYGSTGGKHLNKPIVGIASSPDGHGYWLVASDGGIFAYGDARFYGSTGNIHLNKPIDAIAPTADGHGYWLVASDGGIFAFGDATFHGSAGQAKLTAPVVGIAPTHDGQGYWLATQAGAVYAYGDATSFPNAVAKPSAPAVVAIVPAAYPLGGTPATTTTSPARSTTTVPPRATTTTLPRVTTTTFPGTSPFHPYAPRSNGYDVSWPQCQPKGSASTQSLPNSPPFAVVGINNGYINGFNSCLSAEASWAGPNVSVYIILQPAAGGSPPAEMTGPDAGCAKSSPVCRGYDWGWNYAKDDLAFAAAKALHPRVWWLDVEIGEGWVTSASARTANAAVAQGALDALSAAGDKAGIYATWYQWGLITGAYLPKLAPPIWVAGAQTLSGGSYSAQAYCVRAEQPGDPRTLASTNLGFAGGTPWLVQYGYVPGAHPIDPDYACG